MCTVTVFCGTRSKQYVSKYEYNSRQNSRYILKIKLQVSRCNSLSNINNINMKFKMIFNGVFLMNMNLKGEGLNLK